MQFFPILGEFLRSLSCETTKYFIQASNQNCLKYYKPNSFVKDKLLSIHAPFPSQISLPNWSTYRTNLSYQHLFSYFSTQSYQLKKARSDFPIFMFLFSPYKMLMIKLSINTRIY